MVQLGINILVTASVILLVAQGFSMIYYPTKFFHIAHAVIITTGAYFTYMYSYQMGLPISISIVLSLLTSTFLGVLIEKLLYKKLRKYKTPSLGLLLASLGLYIVLQNIISIIWGDRTLSIRSAEVVSGNEFFGAYITNIQIITILFSVLLMIATMIFMKYSRIGKDIRAVSSNSELSTIFGIDSDKTILWAFIIGSFLAAVVGILVSFDKDMTPTMGFHLMLYGVVVMIIGGIGSTKGLIGGALLLATAQHVGGYYFDSKWMEAIAYVILIVFLIWKPLGFSGQRLKKVEI